MNTHIALPVAVFTELTSYISNRPYYEVSQLFSNIQQRAVGITITPNTPPAADEAAAEAAADAAADAADTAAPVEQSVD
jgi:hypothetical protein